MKNRREFIKRTAALGTALSLGAIPDLWAGLKKEGKLGIQLFSIPKMLSENFENGLKMLQKQGYKELEFYGPYPFSAEAAIKGWEGISKMLGFSGSGYFGKTPADIKKIFKEYGFTSPATHTDLDTLEKNMGPLAESAHLLGQKYVVLPAIPEDRRKTPEDYRRIADDFNRIGENAQKHGVKFGYHNHGYGLKPVNGIRPLEVILGNTEPGLVFFEMDIFWTTCGGADPLDLLSRYAGRYKMLHLKDMKEKKQFAGDGNSAQDWFPMFPLMTSAGDGVLNVQDIVAKARETGVEHYFVEQDMVADPETALKKSADFLLKKLG